jgi:hypothetical protein
VGRPQRHDREARVELGRERQEILLVCPDPVEEDEERRRGSGRARREMEVADEHAGVV